MIKLKTILSLSPLSLALEKKGINVSKKSADWVQGLVGVSVGIVPYTRDNLADQVPDATGPESEHTYLQNEAATLMADAVKDSFIHIRKYLRPFNDKLNSRIESCITPDPEGLLLDNTNIYFEDLWCDFFDHPLFPETKPSGTFDYHNFSFSGFRKVGDTLPSLEYEQLLELLELNDLGEMGVFIDKKDIGRAYSWFLREPNALYKLFKGDAKDGIVDVVNARSEYETWIALYVLTSKLIVLDAPIKGVIGVTLDDYETYLHTIHNFTIAALQAIRTRNEILSKQRILVRIRPVKSASGDDRYGPVFCRERDYVPKLPGVDVGLTKEGLAFVDSKEGTLSEAVIGYVLTWHDNKQGSKGQANIIDGWDAYIQRYRLACKEVIKYDTEISAKKLTNEINKTIQEFQKEHEEFKTFCLALNNEPEFMRLSKAMETEIYREVQIITRTVINGKVDKHDYLARSSITIELAKILGFKLAAFILEGAVTTGNKSVEERRIALGKSVARALVKMGFNQ